MSSEVLRTVKNHTFNEEKEDGSRECDCGMVITKSKHPNGGWLFPTESIHDDCPLATKEESNEV